MLSSACMVISGITYYILTPTTMVRQSLSLGGSNNCKYKNLILVEEIPVLKYRCIPFKTFVGSNGLDGYWLRIPTGKA